MGIWDFYFIAKLYLYFGHYMGFHAWLNMAFAVFLSVPRQGQSMLPPVQREAR